MKKCQSCGIVKLVTIPCRKCRKDICLNCINLLDGICADCESEIYTVRYHEKIKRYEDAPL